MLWPRACLAAYSGGTQGAPRLLGRWPESACVSILSLLLLSSAAEGKAQGSFGQTGALLTSFLPVGPLMSSGRDRSLPEVPRGCDGAGADGGFL